MTPLQKRTRPKKLLEQLQEQLRARHYALRTENAYISWAENIFSFTTKNILKIWA